MNNANALIKCVPDLINGIKAKPSTVCVITCKENNLRFKHRCNRNGQWDQAPVFDKCGTVVSCPHPNANTLWINWSWSCSGRSQGSKCNGVCKLNSDTIVQISCGKDGNWTSDLNLTDASICPIRGKLMIVGGNVTDILDLDDETTTCNVLSPYPFQVDSIQAGVLNSKPIFCGGQECFEYTTQGFKSFANLTYEADYFSASTVVQIEQQSVLWISGGYDMEDKSQVVLSNGTVSEGPVMPEKIMDHCVVAINKTTVLVTGGMNDNGYATKKTYGYNFESGQWSNGSELINERVDHGCGVFQNSTGLVIAVIGGYDVNGEYLDSVEFAVLNDYAHNTPTLIWEWKNGPQFPFNVFGSTVVSTNAKLYVVGGYQGYSYPALNTIFDFA